MELLPLFKLMAEKKAADMFFTADAPIMIKIEGVVMPINNQKLTGEHVKQLAYGIMNETQIAVFERELEMNFGYPLANLGNYRVNVFKQRGDMAMVIRHVKATIPTIEELKLPQVLKELTQEKRGLILVVGATGSGKSSTLAAMLEQRNKARSGHILTFEDPIEFQFEHRKSIVNQREVGIDTLSFENALKNAMREAPDVIMIGEIRDRSTLQYALNFAQSGHLCLSTLHANNSYHVLNRIINFFPTEARPSLLMDLSVSLKAVVSQRLVRGKDGKLIPAVEILQNSNHIADLIREGQIEDIKQAMEKSLYHGTQTFEQALYKLFKQDLITMDEALAQSDSPTNLAWMIHNSETVEEEEAARKKQTPEEQKQESKYQKNEGASFKLEIFEHLKEDGEADIPVLDQTQQ